MSGVKVGLSFTKMGKVHNGVFQIEPADHIVKSQKERQGQKITQSKTASNGYWLNFSHFSTFSGFDLLECPVFLEKKSCKIRKEMFFRTSGYL